MFGQGTGFAICIILLWVNLYVSSVRFRMYKVAHADIRVVVIEYRVGMSLSLVSQVQSFLFASDLFLCH